MSELQMIRNNENNIPMSNIKKDKMGVNIIQHKTNRFWEYYSKFLIRFSWLILIISLLLTIGLTICLLCFIQVRQFDQKDFFIQNGPAIKNAKRLLNLFGDDQGFRVHQQMELYPALDIIIKRKLNADNDDMNQTNLLDNQIINEIHVLDKHIQSIKISDSKNSFQHDFSSLCQRMNRACVVDGNYLLSNKFRQDALSLPYIPSGIYFDSLTGANGISSFIFSKHHKTMNVTEPEVDYKDDEEAEAEAEAEEEEENVDSTKSQPLIKEVVSYVPIFRLRYTLNASNDEMRDLSMKWERKVLEYLNEKFQSPLISLSASTSEAIADLVGKQAREEGPFMAIMLLIFFIFVCFFTSIQGNFHTSVAYLSFCGIISFALSSGTTFGILSVFKIPIIEPMALLVFVIAINDCMRVSIICGEYHRIIKEYLPTNSTNLSTKLDIDKILPSVLKSTYPYFFSSTLILIIVYLIISFISPMLCIRYLGLTLILYVFINYLTHCTFFLSCFVLTLKRIQSRRHCLFCHQLPHDYHIKDRKKSIRKSLTRKTTNLFSNVDSVFKKFFTAILCLLSLIFIIYSVWLTLSIDTRLFNDKFLPRNATSLRSYMKSQTDDYDIGPIIMITIPEPVNYENKNIQSSMHRIVKQCQNEQATNDFKLLWLDQENIQQILTSRDSLDVRITPYSQNDLIVKDTKNKSIIQASRFYCQYRSINGDREDLRTMNNMYTYAKQSSIPSMFPYSVVFPLYESLGQIRIEIYILILCMVITTCLITLLIFFSFKKAFLLFSQLLALLCGYLACLYLFHNISFNFANALWLYIIPVIYLDTLIHTCFNIKKSKWKYNRVILSLIISLIILSFFSIESYIFLMIRNSIFYQSIICFILINLILPSWRYIIKKVFKKNKREKVPIEEITTGIIDTNQPLTAEPERQNLVDKPNGTTTHDSV